MHNAGSASGPSSKKSELRPPLNLSEPSDGSLGPTTHPDAPTTFKDVRPDVGAKLKSLRERVESALERGQQLEL